MKLTNCIYWLSLTTIIMLLSFCTPKRTVKLIANKNIYLEKKGKYCNLLYKNNNAKYILVADSVTQVIAYDSVFAYSRVKLSTYPNMTIVKVDKDEKFTKQDVDGLSFTNIFPTFFSFQASTKISHAVSLYDFMLNPEEKINDADIIVLSY